MNNLNNKPCRKCGSTERYKPRPGRKLGQCKTCTKTRDKARYQFTFEKQRAYSKSWGKANAKRKQANNEACRKANPEKASARKKVQNAARLGQLPRVSTCTCVDCGIPATEYHHEDYSKPLEVVALCKECHVKRHHPSTNELTNHSHQT